MELILKAAFERDVDLIPRSGQWRLQQRPTVLPARNGLLGPGRKQTGMILQWLQRMSSSARENMKKAKTRRR